MSGQTASQPWSFGSVQLHHVSVWSDCITAVVIWSCTASPRKCLVRMHHSRGHLVVYSRLHHSRGHLVVYSFTTSVVSYRAASQVWSSGRVQPRNFLRQLLCSFPTLVICFCLLHNFIMFCASFVTVQLLCFGHQLLYCHNFGCQLLCSFTTLVIMLLHFFTTTLQVYYGFCNFRTVSQLWQ